MTHFFHIQYLNTQPITSSSTTRTEMIEPDNNRSYFNIDDEYISNIEKDVIEMTKTVQDAYDIEQFLSGPVFEECEGEINIYEHFRMENHDIFVKKPQTEAGARSQSIKSMTAKVRTRRMSTGFQKLCDMSGQKLQLFLRVWFRSRPQDFCTLFDIKCGKWGKCNEAPLCRNQKKKGNMISKFPKQTSWPM